MPKLTKAVAQILRRAANRIDPQPPSVWINSPIYASTLTTTHVYPMWGNGSPSA